MSSLYFDVFIAPFISDKSKISYHMTMYLTLLRRMETPGTLTSIVYTTAGKISEAWLLIFRCHDDRQTDRQTDGSTGNDRVRYSNMIVNVCYGWGERAEGQTQKKICAKPPPGLKFKLFCAYILFSFEI